MISVGVLVDLWWRSEAGGHVKCWERFAEAATAANLSLDLTLYFLGNHHQVIPLSNHVRYVIHPPVFSTQILPFLGSMSEHTDLAPLNPRLIRLLRQHDILHATHPLFTLGQTARWVASRYQIPLVASLHTDVPRYTQIQTAQVIQQVFGQRWIAQLLLDRWQWDHKAQSSAERKLAKYWKGCHHVFVSQPDDYQRIAQLLPTERISYLRRGIDRTLFHSKHRDRDRLLQHYKIAPDRFLLLYVGRLDACKNVQTFAQAVRLLLDRQYPVQALMAGQGDCADQITALLRANVTLLGVVPQSVLSWLYASADLFVFPSETEIYSNAVVEAKASGLPILVSKQGGSAQMVHCSGQDGLLLNGRDPADWAEAIISLMNHPESLATMRHMTYEQSQKDSPSWKTVLMEDLYPIWKATTLNSIHPI